MYVLILQVWSEAQDPAFVTSSQVVLVLLGHPEKSKVLSTGNMG